MTISRLNWTDSLPAGARVVPVILVAGVPVVLVPAGLHPTTVAATSGSIDPLFWLGPGSMLQLLPDSSWLDPVRALLNPAETYEVYEKINMLKGSVSVEPLTFSLQDVGGAATLLVSNREGRVAQALGADLGEFDVSVPLASVVGMPANGIACLGRETITYTGVSGGNLTGVIRGKYGSAARFHAAPTTHTPVVTAGLPPHWQGRLCTFWLCALSADGTTLSDPTLLYAGTVGAGVQMTRNLTTWSIPLDHITESLGRKVSTPPINLYGWAHYDTSTLVCPLRIRVRRVGIDLITEDTLLDDESDENDNGGWHASTDAFVQAAQRKVSSLTGDVARVAFTGDGRIQATASGSNALPVYLFVNACWDPTNILFNIEGDDDQPLLTWTSTSAAPEACFPLFGWIRIPEPTDFAGIPSTLNYTFTSTATGATGAGRIALFADSDQMKNVACSIMERDATGQRIFVQAVSGVVDTTHVFPLLCTKRTVGQLGIVATGDSAVVALRAGAKALDALCGQDLNESLVDWDDLESKLTTSPGGLPETREFHFVAGKDTFLDILIQEFLLRGMALTVRFGRITGIRLQNFADSEASVASIGETDILVQNGVEIPIEVADNTGAPLASSMLFQVPNGTDTPTPVTISDTTYGDEFGPGETVQCTALIAVPLVKMPPIAQTLSLLYQAAQQVLGPLAEPNRALKLTLSPRFMFLQSGMLVRLTHSRVPTWVGTRGIADVVCQVQEVRRSLFGGKLQAIVTLRFQSSAAFGYAPEALIASSSGAVLTMDTLTPWGPTCFAQDTDANGDPSTDCLDGFEVGDVVALTYIGSATPPADEIKTIVSIDHVANTVTLNSAPSSPITVRFALLLRFVTYASATPREEGSFAWIADASTQVLGSGDPAKRWAA